jgi:folate-binding protein YgfZ
MTTPSPVVARIARDVVAISGTDAAEYLHGQLSQDVARLGTDDCAWSFVLSPQGKVDGWGRVQRLSETSFAIDVDPGAGTIWEARLRRFLLRTRADIAITERVPSIAIRGATVPGGLACGWPGTVGSDLLGVPDDIEDRLRATLGTVTWVTDEALECRRIRAGVPRWGTELDHDTIPASTGQWVVDASVSFTKGCYTGQELVARIDSRGAQAPRMLAGFDVDGPAPAPGTEVAVGDHAAGPVTSAAGVTGVAASVALAYVPRSIELVDGAPATVGGVPARLRTLPMSGTCG